MLSGYPVQGNSRFYEFQFYHFPKARIVNIPVVEFLEIPIHQNHL